MELITETVDGILKLSFQEKRLDSRLAIDFKDKVSELITASGISLVVLDLSMVEFIDSSGIGCLVSCLKLLGTKGKIAIWGLKPSVETMFKLTRMNRLFILKPNEEEALTALSG